MKWIKISDLINDETFLSLAVIIVPIFVSLFKASKDKMFFFFHSHELMALWKTENKQIYLKNNI